MGSADVPEEAWTPRRGPRPPILYGNRAELKIRKGISSLSFRSLRVLEAAVYGSVETQDRKSEQPEPERQDKNEQNQFPQHATRCSEMVFLIRRPCHDAGPRPTQL
jgi:hypothetical protein